MNQTYKIGDFIFRLIYQEEIIPPDNFLKYKYETDEVQYTYELELCSAYPSPQGKMIMNRPELVVFNQEGLEMRYIGVKGGVGYYACYQEIDDQKAKVYIAEAGVQNLKIDPVFVSLLSLERHMIRQSGVILHCAYLYHQGKAILFSAPSGTGKSTQAGLWEQYRGSHTVNGDRALLQKVEDQWTARGWPVCGSSEICHNTNTPIGAIVMLSQGPDNQAVKLSPYQAFSQIYNQVTVNWWNREAQQKAMDLIENLVTEIPVYHLRCTISEEAVQCLERMLQ